MRVKKVESQQFLRVGHITANIIFSKDDQGKTTNHFSNREEEP